MIISKIYANKKEVFNDVEFNEKFNVIFGEVKNPEDYKKDSHNLGKTLLISIIEFLMLKGLSPSHFLVKHFDRFKNIEFFIEIKLNSGEFLTIKRSVENNTKISFKKHNEKFQDFRKVENSEWDHFEIGLGKAKQILDAYLGFIELNDWSYRKGISYFLRGQNDYQDVFQIEKFIHGKHIEWKPYLAKLLGLNDTLIKTKYEMDDKISKKETELSDLQKKVTTKVEDYDKLKGAIEIKEGQVEDAEQEINKFNFYEEELKINKNLVEEVEEEIANISNDLYNINYEIKEIEDSLDVKIKFNLNEIKQVFDESNIYFKDNLVKNYEEILEFKKSLTTERKKFLKERLEELIQSKKELELNLKEKNEKRAEVLEFIRGEDTFKKFKELQKVLVNKKAEIFNLTDQLDVLDQIITLKLEIEKLLGVRNSLVKEIQKEINEGNPILRKIRRSFSYIIERVFNQSAIISIKLNQEDNLEFNAGVVKNEKTLETTSEGDGTSWRKVLCAAFDLSVLFAYHDKAFFKFVYHDGILEGLDNRKKKNLLSVIKEYCENFEIQYILTAISDDLPRNDNEEKVEFDSEEIILELSDEGDKGRLFKMPKF